MFLDWLHDKGYTFNGNAPISGLTPGELTLEQLGHVLRQEESEDYVEDARSGHVHSKTRKSTRNLAKQKVTTHG